MIFRSTYTHHLSRRFDIDLSSSYDAVVQAVTLFLVVCIAIQLKNHMVLRLSDIMTELLVRSTSCYRSSYCYIRVTLRKSLHYFVANILPLPLTTFIQKKIVHHSLSSGLRAAFFVDCMVARMYALMMNHGDGILSIPEENL